MDDSEEDAALFRKTIGEVTPLAKQDRIPPPKTVVQTRVRSSVLAHPVTDTLSNSQSNDAPEEYLHNGLSRLALRRLRRSRIEDSLDLHGSTVDAARVLLQHFLSEATLHQLRCVRVIHGKGINSRNNEAVLRAHTRHWLIQHPDVLAFSAATPGDGGSGAVIVLLKLKL